MCIICTLTYGVLRKYKVVCASGEHCFKQVIGALNFVRHEIPREEHAHYRVYCKYHRTYDETTIPNTMLAPTQIVSMLFHWKV
jgi:hypothetical protein